MLEPRLITKTELKSRGWTDALIARFFPAPTKENPNPHYRSAAPVKLYDVAQVASIESTAEFKTHCLPRPTVARGLKLRRPVGVLQRYNGQRICRRRKFQRTRVTNSAISRAATMRSYGSRGVRKSTRTLPHPMASSTASPSIFFDTNFHPTKSGCSSRAAASARPRHGLLSAGRFYRPSLKLTPGCRMNAQSR
jgi:hypothetical protein